MIDIQHLRKDITALATRLATRGYALNTDLFNALEAERKTIQVHTEALQSKRNALSKQIGSAKAKGEDCGSLMEEVAGLGDALTTASTQLDLLQNKLNDFLLDIPNLPHESVPVG